MRRALTIPIAIAVAATATFAVDAVASASPAGSSPAGPAVIGHGITLPATSATSATSAAAQPAATPSSVAGYFAPIRATAQKVTATVRVPAVTCGSQKSADYIVVGLGSTTTGAFLGGLIQIGCNQGQASYQAAAYTGSATVSAKLVVSPRDTVMIVVSSGANPVATLTDKTANKTVTGGTAAFDGDTGQFTVQAAGPSFPQFTKVAFSPVRASGRNLNPRTATRLDQYDGATAVLTTSTLTDGTFNVRPAAA